MSDRRIAEERHANLYLHLAERFGWTPAQVNEIDLSIRHVMAKVLGLPPIDDDGTAGTREPCTPEPTPVAPSATTAAQDAGITLTVHVAGSALYDAILPHIQDARRIERLRNGHYPLH